MYMDKVKKACSTCTCTKYMYKREKKCIVNIDDLQQLILVKANSTTENLMFFFFNICF